MDIIQLNLFDGKVCTKCKEWKPITRFNKLANSDKLRSWCVECNRKYKLEHRNKNRTKYNETARQYYSDHKETIRQRQKAAYDADPQSYRDRAIQFRKENHEKVIEWSRRTYYRFQEDRRSRNRKYHADHRDEILRKRKLHWHANADQYKAIHHRWAKENQDKIRAARWRYKARKKDAAGSFTSSEWTALCHWFGDTCLACGSPNNLTIDHVVPLVCGGSNWITNLQPLCVSCNCSKQDKTIDYRDPDHLAAFLESIQWPLKATE